MYRINLSGIDVFLEGELVRNIPEFVKRSCEIYPCAEGTEKNGISLNLQEKHINDFFMNSAINNLKRERFFKDGDIEHCFLTEDSGVPGPFIFSYNAETAKGEICYKKNIPRDKHFYRICGRRMMDPFFNGFCDMFIYSTLLFHNNGFMVHGAGVIDSAERGILICGPSGIGKTTICEKLEKFGYDIIHDDRVIVRKNQDGFFIFPTPWKWKGMPLRNKQGTRLHAVIFLNKGEEGTNRVNRIFGRDIFKKMLENTRFFSMASRQVHVIDIISSISRDVRGFELLHALEDKSDPLGFIAS